jgi:hypothetical protein
MKQLEKDIDTFVQYGKKLSTSTRKMTYSKEKREKLAKKETRLLRTITKAMLTVGGAYGLYALFQHRSDVSRQLTDITDALVRNIDTLTQTTRTHFEHGITKLGAVLQKKKKTRTPIHAPKSNAPKPSPTSPALSSAFFKYIYNASVKFGKTMQKAPTYYVKGLYGVGKLGYQGGETLFDFLLSKGTHKSPLKLGHGTYKSPLKLGHGTNASLI